MKEKLSAFIDAELDELEERQILQQLSQDPELRSTWERYHLLRAAMTHQLTLLVPSGFPARVAEGLAGLDTLRAASSRVWYYASGLAVAASVAAIAIFAFQSFHSPVVPSTPTLASVRKAVSPVSPLAASNGVKRSAEQGLNPYLVGHSEFMPTAGMGGMLPYVRVVTSPDRESK